jgi:tRNA-Thr(GGU) m(6)t(6)A37 methyltransferase TsaA
MMNEHVAGGETEAVVGVHEADEVVDIYLHSIGRIHTPYVDSAPYQPADDDRDEFWITLDPQYREGLAGLEKFTYIYVLFSAHLLHGTAPLTVTPPWAGGRHQVGVFASRSPQRPNPIGLSVVRLKRIVEGTVYTSALDAFDGTPVLDLKPYIAELDAKHDANLGWLDSSEDAEHLALHMRGVPHDH